MNRGINNLSFIKQMTEKEKLLHRPIFNHRYHREKSFHLYFSSIYLSGKENCLDHLFHTPDVAE